MTNEDKNLLFKDLCARLAYGVKLQWFDEIVDLWSVSIDHNKNSVSFNNKIDPYAHDEIYCGYQGCTIKVAPECVKPYLRPFNKLTWDDIEEITEITDCDRVGAKMIVLEMSYAKIQQLTDYLISRHFDVHGLIKKGLALEAPKGMYNP